MMSSPKKYQSAVELDCPDKLPQTNDNNIVIGDTLPNTPKNSVSSHRVTKTSSVEFSEEIKRLEEEGQRLLIAGKMANLDQSHPSLAQIELSPVKDTEGHARSPQRHVSARVLSKSVSSPLRDVQTEQCTIQELRSQLEFQQREMNRLQDQVSGDSPAPCLPLSSALNLASSSYSSLLGGVSSRPGSSVTMMSRERTDARQTPKPEDVDNRLTSVTSVDTVLSRGNNRVVSRSTDTRVPINTEPLLNNGTVDTRLAYSTADIRLPYSHVDSRLPYSHVDSRLAHAYSDSRLPSQGFTNSRLPSGLSDGHTLGRVYPVTSHNIVSQEVTDSQQLLSFRDNTLSSSTDNGPPPHEPTAHLSHLTSLKHTQDLWLPPSHLKKSLKESQEQVLSLRKQLLQLTDTCEKQKREFRSAIEELKTQMHDAVAHRNQIVELKEKEGRTQEGLIFTLEGKVKELQTVNKQQQSVILESTKRVESMNHHGYMTDSALTQIRLLLSDVERRRGRVFNESESLTKQNPAMLIDSFEKCLREFDEELKTKQSHINKLTCDLDQKQTQYTHTINTLTQDHQERVSQIVADQSKQLDAALERASNAREQSTNFQSQLDLLQQQFNVQLKMREDSISSQKSQLEELQEKNEKDSLRWNQKNTELSEKISQVESESSIQREENDRMAQELSQADTILQENKNQISALKSELGDVEEKYSTQETTCAELLASKEILEKQLESQQREITHQEKLIILTKRESELQLQSETASVEKCEQQKSSEKIGGLENELNVMRSRAETAELELGESCTQVNTLQIQVTKLTDRLQVTLSELEANTDSKDLIDKQLEERKAVLDQRCEERDYYRHLVEDKNTELGEVKAERDKLLIQLQENDRNLKTIYQQSSNLSQIVEMNSKNSDSIQKEKENLMERLTNQTVALEESKIISENNVKKLKSREKRLKELEEERKKFKCKLADKYQEVLKIKGDKEKELNSFQKYKYHVTIISKEKDQILSSLRSEKSNLEKQLKKVTTKLKVLEEELSLTQKTFQSKTSVDNKAVKVADKMQKEVTAKRGEIDKLCTKVHWLEESVESLVKAKKSTEVECDGLQDELVKVTDKNKTLSRELSVQKKKHDDLKYKIQRLQSGLEKAAVKNACAQREAEGFEQDIARLKLNHQLEITEVKSYNSSAKSDGITTQTKHHKNTGSESQQSTPTNQQQHTNNMIDIPPLQVFREIGVQLTSLLSQVKSLVSSEGTEASTQSPKLNSGVETRPLSQWEQEAERLKNTVTSPSLQSHTVVEKMKKSDISQHSSNSVCSPGFISATWTCDNTQPESGDWQQTHSTPYSGHSCSLRMPSQSGVDPDSLPCTLELCKRLEAKMKSLSEMGGDLQRENQEMADLIQVQGKKIQQVRNNSGKFHKKR